MRISCCYSSIQKLELVFCVNVSTTHHSFFYRLQKDSTLSGIYFKNPLRCCKWTYQNIDWLGYFQRSSLKTRWNQPAVMRWAQADSHDINSKRFFWYAKPSFLLDKSDIQVGKWYYKLQLSKILDKLELPHCLILQYWSSHSCFLQEQHFGRIWAKRSTTSTCLLAN